MLTLELEPK